MGLGAPTYTVFPGADRVGQASDTLDDERVVEVLHTMRSTRFPRNSLYYLLMNEPIVVARVHRKAIEYNN